VQMAADCSAGGLQSQVGRARAPPGRRASNGAFPSQAVGREERESWQQQSRGIRQMKSRN